jgi:hypothetical protein
MAVGACAKPRRRGFARSCGRVCASMAPSASTASSGLDVGGRSRTLTSVANEVRVWSCNLQTLGDRLDAPTDRASHSRCATGVTCVSSRSVSPLRRRGHAPSPENVSAVQLPVRDLRLVRSRPGVLLVGLSLGGPPPIGPRRPPPPSGQSGRPPGSSGSSTRVSRAREGSDFPPSGSPSHTPR